MFLVSEIKNIIESNEFVADYNWIQQSLVNQKAESSILFENENLARLDYFLDVVLSSCTDWDSQEGYDICRIAAEISEVLSYNHNFETIKQKKYRFRSAILYELAELPALAGASLNENDVDNFLFSFFKRKGPFQKLNFKNGFTYESTNSNIVFIDDLIDSIFKEDALELLKFEQGVGINFEIISERLIDFSKYFSIGLDSSEVTAFAKIIEKRILYSTRNNTTKDLFNKLRAINFPSELWFAQIKALNSGLLNQSFNSWGLAAPTGTGKTFLTRLLIIDSLTKEVNKKILYIVPSRALVYEVSSSLSDALKELEISVISVNPQLTNLDENESEELNEADVIVLTPEKADLLLRIGESTIEEVCMVIVDEAHHIEADTRGILLELYLWRVKRMIKNKARFIFLSAVAPNINSLTEWMGDNPKSLTIEKRANRMRVGVYRIVNNEGWIFYSDGTKIRIIQESTANTNRSCLTQLAEKIQTSGPILTVAKGKKECEHLADEMKIRLGKSGKIRMLSEQELKSEAFNRLDSRLEREMYPQIPLRDFIKIRIAYHHAGLPPRVRMALEDCIRQGLIDFVFATTTLAEGVNFPFSSVIVQSLALREAPSPGVTGTRYKPITPRSFWNIAGRAGRPGFDKEGQVILFEKTLGLERINAVLDNYLNPNLKDIAPVKSALFDSLNDLMNDIKDQNIDIRSLNKIELDESLPNKIKGSINLLRVGLIHAKATNILKSPEEIIDSSFASTFFSNDLRNFSKRLINSQAELIVSFFKQPGAPSEKIVAEMGLSIDTISRLKNYVESLEDWQIKNYRKLFYGGTLNLSLAAYTIGPVSKHIAELEGPKLGGFYSDLILNWLSGIPILVLKNKITSGYLSNQSIESLISVIYSRIQYLLPWGLFAVDCILEEEAKNRKLEYNNEIRSLSYLTDAGVSNLDALRLVNFDFERVDASRLSNMYLKKGGRNLGVDIFGWLLSLKMSQIIECVQGLDKRRIDYDLEKLIKNILEHMSKNRD